MATVSLPKTWSESAAEAITAKDLNDNFTAITTQVNGGLDGDNLDSGFAPPFVNVMAHGATADGVTDDHDAIAAAITAVAAGGTVFFPATADSYKVASSLTITKSVRLIGEGYGSYIKADLADQMIEWTAGSHIEVAHLRLGNASTNAFGVALRLSAASDAFVHHNFFTAGRGEVVLQNSCTYVNISHNIFSGAEDFAISAGQGSHLIISHNQFDNVTTSGVSGPPHVINCEDNNDLVIDGNIIEQGTGMTESGASAIQVFMNDDTTIERVLIANNTMRRTTAGTNDGILIDGTFVDLQVVNNIIQGWNNGINYTLVSGTGQSVRIAGNQVRDSQSRGIYAIASSLLEMNLSIENNQVEGPGDITSTVGGIHVQSVKGVRIVGNTVVNQPADGIDVLGCPDATISGNTANNNSQTDSGTYSGIKLVAEGTQKCDGCLIIGNQCNDTQTTATQGNGIYLAGTKNCLILGNRTVGNTTGITTGDATDTKANNI